MSNIDDFWKYFLQNESALRRTNVSERLISEFENRLHRVAEIDWEIGPGGDGRTRLSLSPSPQISQAVRASKKLLDCAPRLSEWEFTLYKPPRDWKLRFNVVDRDRERAIDATKWEFVLYSFDDGIFDIVFKPDKTVLKLKKTVLGHAAVVIVDGELGERVRLERFGDISVVSEWDADQAQAAQRLELGMLAEIMKETA